MATPPGRQKRSDAQRNYSRLIAAADAAFSRDGIGASLERIAKAAGVAVGTLYSHFPTRDDLLAQLIADRMNRLNDLGQRLVDAEDPAAGLFEWLEAFGAGATAYEGLPESVIRIVHDPQSPLFKSCENLRQTCAALLERAQRAGQVRIDTTAIDVLAMTAALYSAAAGGGHDSGHFLAVLIAGLRKSP